MQLLKAYSKCVLNNSTEKRLFFRAVTRILEFQSAKDVLAKSNADLKSYDDLFNELSRTYPKLDLSDDQLLFLSNNGNSDQILTDWYRCNNISTILKKGYTLYTYDSGYVHALRSGLIRLSPELNSTFPGLEFRINKALVDDNMRAVINIKTKKFLLVSSDEVYQKIGLPFFIDDSEFNSPTRL